MSKPILDNLFGSKVRVKILKFLYRNFPADFSVREISQRIQESPQATKQELDMMREITIVKKIVR